MQKLATSLDEKELYPETGISASDEFKYEWAIDTFLQYGNTLDVIDQVNTHGYHGAFQPVLSPVTEASSSQDADSLA